MWVRDDKSDQENIAQHPLFAAKAQARQRTASRREAQARQRAASRREVQARQRAASRKDGWFSDRWDKEHHPGCVNEDASRYFLDDAATPPRGDARRGIRQL